MRVRLEVTKGPASGKAWDFDEPEIFIFGRNPEAQCSIGTDGAVSGNHFMLQLNPPDCVLIDLNSTNGTKINTTHYIARKEKASAGYTREPPQPVRLRHGDRIVAGVTRFRVSIAYELVCERCEAKFVVHGDDDFRRLQGRALCQDCAGVDTTRGAGKAQAGPLSAAPGRARRGRVRCGRCGTDATDEAGARAATGSVDYVCRRCRNTTVRDPAVRAALERARASELRAIREGGVGKGSVGKGGVGGAAPPRRGVPVAGRPGQAELGGIDLADGPPPPEVEEYEFLRFLGIGGNGAVYLARETYSGDLVAVKTLLPEVAVREEAAALFEREADIAGSLRHANIVRMRMRGRVGPVFYCVMEYVAGTDVDHLIQARGGRVPRGETLEIMLQALDGLAFAHEHRIVHRDLKPANILLEGRAPPWRALVTDFGLAKNFEHAGLSGLTMGDTQCGTPWYMPREQIIRYRWVRPTCDVYAAGATLYYMLTGKPAKRGLEGDVDVPAAVRAITSEAPVPVRKRDRSIPPAVAQVIDRSLHDEEARRYRNAGSMRRALLRAMRG